MPVLGADMTAGTLVEWRKRPGEAVGRGEIIAEVETEKGVIEVECFTPGVIERLLVEPGQKVPVGTPLAVIREAGGAAPAAPGPPAPAAPPPTRVRASPVARRVAADLGVSLETVRGTGPGGAITREDVERAAPAARGPRVAAPREAAPPDRAARMRQAVAAAVTRSKRDIPHYYLSTPIDLGTALAWLAERNRDRPVTERLVVSALFLKAVALSLRDFPDLNGRWADGRVVPAPGIHVGLVVALREGGLVVPALHDADQLPVERLMASLLDIVERARAGALRSSEVADSTMSVTILGDRDVDTIYGVIYPPQVAIVGFGRVAERPWVVGGRVEVRPSVTATLAADHRASDGHRGSAFLTAVAERLQHPEAL
jgi:pyruvate dehydrogenase E2 component (dihydrolipoamide acetyltransferase)